MIDEPAQSVPNWRSPATVAAVATVTQILLAVAAGWFLLQQLTPVLRPLLVAAFLAYMLQPYHSRLRKHIGSPASIGVLAGATAILLFILAFTVYASVLGLNEDLPRLQTRAIELTKMAENVSGVKADQVVGVKTEHVAGVTTDQEVEWFHTKITEQMKKVSGPLLNVAADAMIEACVVAMYLLFLLLEGSQFPHRVRAAYSPERADEILKLAGQVSGAIVGYLWVKIRASLILAVPVGLILWALDVKFAMFWLVLTFFCNFIPYLGPIAAYILPVGFAFLWFGVEWRPVTAAVLLLLCQIASAILIEPTMIGKAVGLSPLVLLVSLAFWGLLWGIPGMFLAVPLTVVAIIVMDHFDSTRAAAQLLRGG